MWSNCAELRSPWTCSSESSRLIFSEKHFHNFPKIEKPSEDSSVKNSENIFLEELWRSFFRCLQRASMHSNALQNWRRLLVLLVCLAKVRLLSTTFFLEMKIFFIENAGRFGQWWCLGRWLEHPKILIKILDYSLWLTWKTLGVLKRRSLSERRQKSAESLVDLLCTLLFGLLEEHLKQHLRDSSWDWKVFGENFLLKSLQENEIRKLCVPFYCLPQHPPGWPLRLKRNFGSKSKTSLDSLDVKWLGSNVRLLTLNVTNVSF